MTAGFRGQLGFKSETTWGTAVTVDQFIPILSEGITADRQRLESKGIRAGRRVVTKWRPGRTKIGGPIKTELHQTNLATLLRHMFGTIATTGSGPYTHTASPGDLTGKSLTIQVGKPDVGGTVRPFTYAGCKIPSWELTCREGELAELNLDISAATEATATALATASYDAALTPFSFVEGSVTIAGASPARVKEFSLAAQNSLAVDRFGIGSATVKQQLENGMRPYTGRILCDFESLTHHDLYVNGTENALVLSFSNGTQSLTITMNARYDGTTPSLAGEDLLEQPLPFVCVGSTDAAAITAVLVNSESSSA